MNWKRQGLIWQPGGHWWSQMYGMMPTPHYMPEKNRIRIYFGTTDKNNFGRTTFLEVDADNPSQIVYEHNNFILDLGEDGTFDDCGVIPSCVLKEDKEILLYTFGFQRSFKVPILMNGGLAISTDGKNFRRYSQIPILPRHPAHPFFQSAPTVIKTKSGYTMFYPFGVDWFDLNGIKIPEYHIGQAHSKNGKSWQVIKNAVLSPDKKRGEFGFGRPWVVMHNNQYWLFFSRRYLINDTINYRITYAHSTDGQTWQRANNDIMDVSPVANDWDSEMVCYAAVIQVKEKWLMFYNGNGNGKTGFGFAELKGGL